MRSALILIVVAMLFGCGKSETPVAIEPAKIAPAVPVKKHNYSFRDGFEYGYERAPSAEDQNRGQKVSSLIMAKYAGTKDGKYQVYIKEAELKGVDNVLECTNPCEFFKVMTFFDGRLVNMDRMRAEPGIIGWMMLQDAINGELEQNRMDKNGRKFNIWFDEKKGLQTSLAG